MQIEIEAVPLHVIEIADEELANKTALEATEFINAKVQGTIRWRVIEVPESVTIAA